MSLTVWTAASGQSFAFFTQDSKHLHTSTTNKTRLDQSLEIFKPIVKPEIGVLLPAYIARPYALHISSPLPVRSKKFGKHDRIRRILLSNIHSLQRFSQGTAPESSGWCCLQPSQGLLAVVLMRG